METTPDRFTNKLPPPRQPDFVCLFAKVFKRVINVAISYFEFSENVYNGPWSKLLHFGDALDFDGEVEL